ncbi:MAG: lipoyl synthase [Desulfomonilia bacterium]
MRQRILEKPSWLRKKLPLDETTKKVEAGLSSRRLHTICQEGCCPNQGECFSRGEATFLVMGRVCTRNCRFCAVESGRPSTLDPGEPDRLAEEVAELGLKFVVITSVTRDDLPDGGASHFARVIHSVRRHCPGVGIEVLIPDFKGSSQALRTVIEASPDVLNHNVETIARLYPDVRPQADYHQSLNVLRRAKEMDPATITKSGFMVGLGERGEEILDLMDDLRDAGCDILTIGQYLQPSVDHFPVQEYVHPDIFAGYAQEAEDKGFLGVVSSPFVRSSYKAGELFRRVASSRS